MRTNSKSHPVFTYLTEAISEEITGTLPERLQEVCRRFDSEVNHTYNKRRIPNLQTRFADWLMGLPSALNVEYRHHAILELAEKWGAIPGNATEKQQDRILQNWFYFAALKFFQLCKQNKVNTDFLH
jgi:hypothetical protein